MANCPRTPLGWWVEAFTLVRLLGDPIGCLQELIRKLDSCQTRLGDLQVGPQADGHLQGGLDDEELADITQIQRGMEDRYQQRFQNALALIITSYDEFGKDVGDLARRQILLRL